MSNLITFGRYEGKSFEWLFFNRPGYVEWLYDEGIPHQDHFGEEECEYFLELHRRATSLTGPCPRCQQPITRMGLTTHRGGRLGAVGYYCDRCEYQGGSRTGYYTSSFFVDAYGLEPWEEKMVRNEIRRTFIGTGNRTQKRMKEFFHRDANFMNATPGFFAPQKLDVAA